MAIMDRDRHVGGYQAGGKPVSEMRPPPASVSKAADRPEDIANRDYYANMPTRRYRVTWDIDVEWRDNDLAYAEQVAALAPPSDGPRVLAPTLVSIEALDA